jgi:hypothetical protein
MKLDFMNSKHYGKISGITVRMESEKNFVIVVKKLVAFKLQLKK